jgi:3',5'-cyclic AMP phosphodiesterase CpdA
MFFFCLLINGNMLAQTDTLSFLHITDLHIIFNQDGYHPDMMEYRKQKKYDQGEPRLRQFLQTVPTETNSNLVIATGDLCDFFEGETKDGQLLDLQAEQFSRLLSEYNIPVLLTLGNHDAFTFNWQDGKLYPNQNFAGRARAAWVRNFACFKDGTYYSKTYQVGKTTFRLIFLDDIFFSFRPEENMKNPYLDKFQLCWLRDQLQESENDIEIILMHIPFTDILGAHEYSNELYSMLAANPSVKLILAGHQHKNIVEIFPLEEDNKIVQVQTGAFAGDINNWRQIKLTENQILVSFPGKTENEITIQVK